MSAVADNSLLERAEQLKRDGVVIRTYDLWKTYVMGDQEIHAVSLGLEFPGSYHGRPWVFSASVLPGTDVQSFIPGCRPPGAWKMLRKTASLPACVPTCRPWSTARQGCAALWPRPSCARAVAFARPRVYAAACTPGARLDEQRSSRRFLLESTARACEELARDLGPLRVVDVG